MIEDRPTLVALVAIAFVLGLLVVGLVVSSRAEAQCLAAGYPGSSVTWNLRAYCVKRVNQTDVVVPLREVERGHD